MLEYLHVVLKVYLVTGGILPQNDPFAPTIRLSSTELLVSGSSHWVETGALPSPRSVVRGVTVGNIFYLTGEILMYTVLRHHIHI